MDTGERDNGWEGGPDPGHIGPILEKRRLEKGLTLKDVEKATMIRARYLEGLEREDPTVLPDPVYARGFLKTYANFLGLDGDALARELKDRRAPRRERQIGQSVAQSPGEPAAQGRDGYTAAAVPPGRASFSPGGDLDGAERRGILGRTILTVALAVLALAVVVGALYFIGRGSQQEEEKADDPSPTPSREEAAEDEPGAAPPEVTNAAAGDDGAEESEDAAGPVRVALSVVGSSSPMTVYADGAVAYDGVAQPGFSRTFEAQETVTVSSANAGPVEVEVDGSSQGRLGSPGQSVTRDFAPRED